MRRVLLLFLVALALGGCADAAWRLGALAIDVTGACLKGELCSSTAARPAPTTPLPPERGAERAAECPWSPRDSRDLCPSESEPKR